MGDLQIEKGSGAKPRVTFYADGVATDLDGACTVTLTKPDGTAGPASGTVSHVSPTGSGTYEFTLGQQTDLTWYDVTWAGTVGSVATSVNTRVEVIGAHLFTLAGLRAVKVARGTPFTDTTTYPDSMVMARRAEVTDDFEARTGWSFVPRFTRERHSGDGSSTLIVRQHKPGDLLSITVDGTAQTVADFDLTPDGVLTWYGGTFPTTRPGNVWVEYVRGWDRPPAEISEVGLARTATLLLPSLAGSTVSTWTTPDGTTYSYDQAGQAISGGGRRHYGVAKIDSVLNEPSYHARGGVFA